MAVYLNSTDPVFLYKRSQIFTQLKRYEDALGDIEDCLRLARNPQYYIDEAHIYLLMGKKDKALDVLNGALIASPGDLSLKSLKSELENQK